VILEELGADRAPVLAALQLTLGDEVPSRLDPALDEPPHPRHSQAPSDHASRPEQQNRRTSPITPWTRKATHSRAANTESGCDHAEVRHLDGQKCATPNRMQWTRDRRVAGGERLEVGWSRRRTSAAPAGREAPPSRTATGRPGSSRIHGTP